MRIDKCNTVECYRNDCRITTEVLCTERTLYELACHIVDYEQLVLGFRYHMIAHLEDGRIFLHVPTLILRLRTPSAKEGERRNAVVLIILRIVRQINHMHVGRCGNTEGIAVVKQVLRCIGTA